MNAKHDRKNCIGYPCEWSEEKTDNPNFDGPKYRYTLWRIWNDTEKLDTVNFCLLNPSTADENELDPTLTRCRNFAQDWGYDAMIVTNLFAYRATSPEMMKEADNPVGLDNNAWLQRAAQLAGVVVAGWGNNGAHRGRAKVVLDLFGDPSNNFLIYSLTETKAGQPGHPLYLKKTATPEIFQE